MATPSNIGLLFRRLAVVGAPLIGLLAGYVALDPFQVLHSDIAFGIRHGVAPNRDFMNTEVLLRQRGAPPYDAFILGNSRSLAFHGRDWLTWIGPARPFHYDAAAESLLGVLGKLQLLERERIAVRHALIVLDDDLLRQTTDTADIVTIKHPEISGGSHIRFQAVFLKAFVSDLFPLKYLDYRLFETYRPYMARAINVRVFTPDPETNDSYFTQSDEEIASQPEQYYAAGRWEGVDRSPRNAAPVINLPQRQMLQDIRAAFDRQSTRYEIVVSPDFGRVRLNPRDVAVLQELFGSDHVHDFSRDPTLGHDIRDWYETAHYRPTVAREIMRRVYCRE